MVQIHKEFTDSQVKELIERYLKREITISYVLEIMGIKRSRFFSCLRARVARGHFSNSEYVFMNFSLCSLFLSNPDCTDLTI